VYDEGENSSLAAALPTDLQTPALDTFPDIDGGEAADAVQATTGQLNLRGFADGDVSDQDAGGLGGARASVLHAPGQPRIDKRPYAGEADCSMIGTALQCVPHIVFVCTAPACVARSPGMSSSGGAWACFECACSCACARHAGACRHCLALPCLGRRVAPPPPYELHAPDGGRPSCPHPGASGR
jgi:hypothetical protein